MSDETQRDHACPSCGLLTDHDDGNGFPSPCAMCATPSLSDEPNGDIYCPWCTDGIDHHPREDLCGQPGCWTPDDAESALIESGFDFDGFVTGYIDAMLWADAIPLRSNPNRLDYDSNWESGGLEHLGVSNETRAEIIEKGQLREFVTTNLPDLLTYCDGRRYDGYDPSQGAIESYAGHDFYLSRSGHGAGFFDRGLGKLGERLQAASEQAGSPDDHTLYDNGDGMAAL